MKKTVTSLVFSVLIILGLGSSLYARDCSKDYMYDRQQSLVVYHYKGPDGKKVDKTYGAWKDVPDDLKKMCWECWVDNLGWYNCKEMEPKNAPDKEPTTLPAPKK